ncbi:hypothetical protein AAFF_G00081780 [Aldrovandia affinis]|uniref:SMP-LTD domain-containing protein n=1 Tax=Aldrovandia affinis TaxID=143900 RepID=A0AAD7T3H4_9TELE|nr:hypothetical protein AAFF_G00081780 [Aldrovandia affinis]
MSETEENELDHGPANSSKRQPVSPPLPQPQWPLQRGIVIQLTGTEGERDSLEDSDLIFTLDGDDDGPPVFYPKERPNPKDGQPEEDWSLRSPAFHVPLSPSSPGSLGDLSISAPSFLSPPSSSAMAAQAPRPLVSLVKSLSTEIESKETSSLKPRPLLSLVKSISTEISRSEPEVSQSKSDSRLNLHLWRQLTQPKGRNGDSRTAPPSPSSLSPCEPKGGFFKVELEDTRRKLSEAMQEPFSMFSKIMGEESLGSPKLQRAAGSSDTPNHKGVCGGGGKLSGDSVVTETHGRSTKKVESDCLSVCDTSVKPLRSAPVRPCLSTELSGKLGSPVSEFEICTYGDLIEVLEIEGRSHRLLDELVSVRPSPPVPGRWLFCVATLAYGYFILPLPSYLSGLSLGLACGFMLGLLLILLLTPRHLGHQHRRVTTLDEHLQSQSLNGEHRDPEVLKGWMNEMHVYDPETYQASLTQSVHVTLEGSCLRLAYPRNNIPRRATYEEQPHETVFVRSRCFQLANSKRVWNKKYPICIMLPEGQDGTEEDTTEEAQEEEQRADQQTLPVTQSGPPIILYLFGRTGREKEEWFQHFLSASMTKDKESHSVCGSRLDVSGLYGSSPSGWTQCSGGSSRGSTEDIPSLLRLRDLAGSMREKILLDYNTYMARFISSESRSPLPSPCASAEGSPTARKKFLCEHSGSHAELQPVWINALIGRIFWDFLREKYWADQVAHKIQKKLSKIRLPYFMNELTLTELDMGTSMPQVTCTSKPSVNHRGLWLELEVVYTGCLQMTLETKMNLCKLGKENGLEADSVPEMGSMASRPRLCILANSDEESSSAGSSDEEELPPSEPQGNLGEKNIPPGAEGHGGGSTSRKILRFVDKIAKSKYFQKATENEYIKKKIEEVSNTPLLLTVEVRELSGTLAVNIPPPPTDRIWYSFCVPPRLDLRVRPKLGEREVTFTHVTEWIEGKLQHEFQKVFVMPNMDDIYLPLMHSGLDIPPASQHSPTESSRQSSLDSLEKPVLENARESD